MSRVDPDQAANYRSQGWTLKKIGEVYGVSKQAIEQVLKEHQARGGVIREASELSKQVLRIRRRRGLAARSVAKQIGVSVNTLSGFETGRKVPHQRTLKLIGEWVDRGGRKVPRGSSVETKPTNDVETKPTKSAKTNNLFLAVKTILESPISADERIRIALIICNAEL